MAEDEIDIFKSELVPKHEILNEEEKIKLLEEYNIALKQLPKISEDDPAVKRVNAKRGDVLRIKRNSGVSGETLYFRVVV